uniref:Calcipressin n=1 Tax=Schizophyllum commune (strain H4-8 / FGSC 9210) TaxID=578458 RepID=D8PU63_SCHCM
MPGSIRISSTNTSPASSRSHSRSSSAAHSLHSPTSPDRTTSGPATTNTLAVTRLPASFFDPLILDILRDHFAQYGPINQWAPLSGFGRILVVYERDASAEAAREACGTIVVEPTDSHVAAEPIILRVERQLAPPRPERNFLISPPGSPPVGWEQAQEEPPNSAPLAEDLIHALKALQIKQEEATQTQRGAVTLLDPAEQGGAGVGVFVEDCDVPSEEEEESLKVGWERKDRGDIEEDYMYGQLPPKWKPVTAMPPMAPTSMPPMRA